MYVYIDSIFSSINENIDFFYIRKYELNERNKPIIPFSLTLVMADIEKEDDYFINIEKIAEAITTFRKLIVQYSIINNKGIKVLKTIEYGKNIIRNVPFSMVKENSNHFLLEDKVYKNINNIFKEMYIQQVNEWDYLNSFKEDLTDIFSNKEEVPFSKICVFQEELSGYECYLNEEELIKISHSIRSIYMKDSTVDIFDFYSLEELKNLFLTYSKKLYLLGEKIPTLPNYVLEHKYSEKDIEICYNGLIVKKVPTVFFCEEQLIPYDARKRIADKFAAYLRKQNVEAINY